jgi:hypothetical protein
MVSATDLTKMVPGFEFLQNLVKTVGNAIPGVPAMSQWVAPTLDPEELDKRIQELKTVQFWLEQNARLMATTIQALEVQRMTLSTFKSMNMPLSDLRDALKIGTPKTAAEPVVAPKRSTAKKKVAAKVASKALPATPAVDPMQWWGALTQQFTELASKAVKESAADAAVNLAGNLAGAAVKQSLNTAGKVLGAATRKRSR